jgi:hypothetical protein
MIWAREYAIFDMGCVTGDAGCGMRNMRYTDVKMFGEITKISVSINSINLKGGE